jgi:hypothetical protein
MKWRLIFQIDFDYFKKCKKLKANALFVVVVIALILAVLSTSLILVAYTYRQYIQENNLKLSLETNSVSGANLLLAKGNSLAYNEPFTTDLFENGLDSVTLKRVRWGVYDIGISIAFRNIRESSKVFLMGSKTTSNTNAAIYLVDEGTPLIVCGGTKVTGTCYLPERGVKGGSASNQPYKGDKYVFGPIKKSSNKLPPINKAALENIISILEIKTDEIQENFDLSSKTDLLYIQRSFLDTTIFIYSKESIVLDAVNFTGNVIVKSEERIIIKERAHLEDVIILAPRIFFESGFHGTVQAFATDSLDIGKGCELIYPSVVGILKTSFTKKQPSLVLHASAKVSGLLFSYQQVEDTKRTLIKLEEESSIYGHVYSDGFVELSGIVTGGILCKRFILNTPSSYYENYLLNAQVNSDALSTNYLLPTLLETQQNKAIQKWLF